MAYLGNTPAKPTQSPAIVTNQTATNLQTSFTVAGGYSVGFLEVYQNGVRLVPTTDYTASTGTTVVLVTGATTNDELMFVAYQTTNIGAVATASVANAIAGGSAGQIPYQTGSGQTSLTTTGVSGQVLQSAGSGAPVWGTVDTNKAIGSILALAQTQAIF